MKVRRRLSSWIENRALRQTGVDDDRAATDRSAADRAVDWGAGRIWELSGKELEQTRAQLAALEQRIADLENRFKTRPYMAVDAFNAFGNLDEPMGYTTTSDELKIGFADLFRGAQSFIGERQRRYLPLLIGRGRVIDLGCGRGEFLRLMGEAGISAVGVELDGSLVERLRGEGLQVVEADAVTYLREQASGSLDAIFSAQVIEHLTPEQLTEVLALAASRLRPGGLFIAETVNPESYEAVKAFPMDLTHQRLIFPQVLLFLCREAGFSSARIFYPEGGGFTQRHYTTAGEYAVVATV